MSVLSNQIQEPNTGEVTPQEVEQVERALIDASTRTPVLFFFGSAVFWLLIQTVLGVVASLKVHWPEFLTDCPFLTYGRVVPAQMDVMVYGWASMAGIGVAIWMLARMSRVALPRAGSLVIAGGLWNLGVFSGLIEVLVGNSQGYELLEFPKHIFFVLFFAYAIIGSWGFVLFRNRRPGHAYISTWYLVAALFWFPWLLAGGNLLVGPHGLHGVMQAVVDAWYAQNIIGLWLGALGLGAIYYLIPKVVGRPIHSYYLASLGFWSYAIIAAWCGMQRLTGGPVPAWLITVSVAAAILMLVPVATVTANYMLTMRGKFNLVYHSPTIRFTFFGAIAYTVANLVFMFGSFRSVGAITQYSWFGVAENQLFIYAFFSMVMFGAMYYIVPRLVGCEWLSASFIRIHFWGSAYGFAMSILMLMVGGAAQGSAQSAVMIGGSADLHADFLRSVFAMLPFMRGRSIAMILMCIGHLTFALHFLLMLLRLGRPSGQPTLFAPIQEGAKS